MTELELRKYLTIHKVNAETLELLWKGDSEPVYGLIVSGEDAIAHWTRLHQLVDQIKHYPLLLGARQEIDNHRDYVGIYAKSSTTEIIEQGSRLNSDNWLHDCIQELREDWSESEESDEDSLGDLFQPLLGEWSDDIPAQQDFTIPYDYLSQRPLSEVAIALIPTQACWQVPAHLKFGNWNSCPAPEVHVCLMKRWYERYGAEVVGISHDIVEMRVANPPLDRESAFNLAIEQYLYCYDIVEQGVGSLSDLAATLLKGSAWFFWWD